MSISEQLAATLQGEYAATYAYGIIGAHVDGAAVDRAQRALWSHQNNRDRLRESLAVLQAPIPVPEPAYEAAPPVTNAAAAAELAIIIELRLTRQWAAVAALAAGPSRRDATRIAQECAVRAVAWGDTTSAYPGDRPVAD